MAVYTSQRKYTRNYTGSRIRHLTGYVRPSATPFNMIDVSGMLTGTDTLVGILGALTVPAATNFYTSISANASKGGRVNFSYSKFGTLTLPTGADDDSIVEYCDDGEWSGSLNISYEGPSCDKVRVTGASGSVSKTADSGVALSAITNQLEAMFDTATWLSLDESESGTEYDPTEGARLFEKKDVYDSDATDLPTAWFDI